MINKPILLGQLLFILNAIVTTDSVETAPDGVKAITDGVETAPDGVKAITDGVETVTDSVETVTDSVETVTDGVETVTDRVETVTDSVEAITELSKDGEFDKFGVLNCNSIEKPYFENMAFLILKIFIYKVHFTINPITSSYRIN